MVREFSDLLKKRKILLEEIEKIYLRLEKLSQTRIIK